MINSSLPQRSPTIRHAAVLAGALLWGVVEVIALARARWSR
ncbi:MAG TPA: hypothetical protein VGM74_07110 [Burkholderiaceae bacterium]|jgi:hypothetical protein